MKGLFKVALVTIIGIGSSILADVLIARLEGNSDKKESSAESEPKAVSE